MSTTKFIFLTPAHHAGMRERVNANRIMTYGPAAGENGSRILFSDVEGLEHYAETPEQIDAMLGVTDGWRPIETAPKDGTWIMTVVGHFDNCVPDVVRWDADWRVWCDENGAGQLSAAGEDPQEGPPYGEFQYDPTHWMPLPKGPFAATGTGEA